MHTYSEDIRIIHKTHQCIHTTNRSARCAWILVHKICKHSLARTHAFTRRAHTINPTRATLHIRTSHYSHYTRIRFLCLAALPSPKPRTWKYRWKKYGNERKNLRKEFRWKITFMHNKFSFINCSLNGVKIMNFRLILLRMIPLV